MFKITVNQADNTETGGKTLRRVGYGTGAVLERTPIASGCPSASSSEGDQLHRCSRKATTRANACSRSRNSGLRVHDQGRGGRNFAVFELELNSAFWVIQRRSNRGMRRENSEEEQGDRRPNASQGV